MTKDQFGDALAQKMDSSKKEALECIDAVLEIITETLSAGDEVRLPGFATFGITERKARQGVNPRTGEKIQIAASKGARFKAGKGLKDAINGR